MRASEVRYVGLVLMSTVFFKVRCSGVPPPHRLAIVESVLGLALPNTQEASPEVSRPLALVRVVRCGTRLTLESECRTHTLSSHCPPAFSGQQSPFGAVSLEKILLEIRSTGPVCFRLLGLPEDSQGFVDKNSN